MIRFLRRFDPRSIRLLVFDLDGTLIDSRLDLIHSVNAMLRHFGRPELAGDVIASYVGDGAPVLVQRALGIVDANTPCVPGLPYRVEDELFKEALDYFLGYYRLHKLDHTTVYDGIPETLAALAGSCGADTPFGSPSQSSGSLRAGSVRPGVQRLMAVLTNKPVRPSQDIVQALGMGDYFVHVYGGNSFATKKPDPLGVRTLLEETGVAPAEALMIGDSSVDVLTGRNAGLWTCGVTYGFAPHTLEEVTPDVLVERPVELRELFG
jgi:phosphoglycolate phosphatase